MGRFREKLYRFMYGRYGVDELYYALFALWFVTAVVGGFTHGMIPSLIGMASIFVMLFRMLSRNISKRRQENEKFLTLWRPFKKWISFQRDRIRDRKTYRYRKCKSCKAIMRLPVKKGKHTAICPKCNSRNGVRIIF